MDWHSRFLQQAAWTSDLRAYLFERTGLRCARRVLEVGCGTGAILSDLDTPAAVHGLDLDLVRLEEACRIAPSAVLTCGDALALPYKSGIFDITFCHFLLLWVHQPLFALTEMKRVTRSGGAVLALAEPDYTSRVDKPAPLAPLGRLQTESLKRQGADPGLGKHLAELFRLAGIKLIETGPLRMGSNSSMARRSREDLPSPAERDGVAPAPAQDQEWAVLEADLADMVPADEIHSMKLVDEQARLRGERVHHVPTYFAWGVV